MNNRIQIPAVTLASAVAFLLAVTVPTPASAKPLDHNLVDAEAEWLLHWDLDGFRESVLGNYLENLSRTRDMEGVSKGVRVKLDEAVRLLHDITAYGGPFSSNELDGVLILRGERRMAQILEAVIINEEASGEHARVETVHNEPFPLYLIERDFYVAFHSPTLVLAGKSLPRLQNAREVIDGDRPSARFETLPGGALPNSDGFFFLGAAENMSNNPALPAKAAILRMAREARLVLGEAGKDLHLAIELVAQDAITANRMEKVIQGMLALVSLTTRNDIDFQDFVSRTTVGSNGEQVTVNFDFPVEALISMIDSEARKRAETPGAHPDDSI